MLWMDGLGEDGRGPGVKDRPDLCPDYVRFYDFSVKPYKSREAQKARGQERGGQSKKESEDTTQQTPSTATAAGPPSAATTTTAIPTVWIHVEADGPRPGKLIQAITIAVLLLLCIIAV